MLAVQALTHYSFHISGGNFLLCDLQGAVVDGTVVLADPVTTSRLRQFGPKDLGPAALTAYMKLHTCTPACGKDWNVPKRVEEAEVPFAPREASLMTDRNQRELPLKRRR